MIQSCPECNGKLSSVAEACPHCEYRQNAKSKSEWIDTSAGVMGIVVVLTVLSLFVYIALRNM